MRSTRGGYTIIEVLIVLAVTTVIFVAAVGLFSGKQGKTHFIQGMRDLESKVQSIVNEVGVSTFPFAENYQCARFDYGGPVGPRPRLTALGSGTRETGTNTDCIFLGKAVHLDTTTDPDRINIYTVLGLRTTNGTTPVIQFSDAKPEVASELTETYQISRALAITQARQDAVPTSSNAYMTGFYNSLHLSSGATTGSQSLKTVGYVGAPPSYGFGAAQTSIRGLGPLTAVDSKVWTICLQSRTTSETAQLIVTASHSGITTEVSYVNCP